MPDTCRQAEPSTHIPAPTPGADAQDVTYLGHDGLTLRAWCLPPQNGAVIILSPGLGGAQKGMLREGAPEECEQRVVTFFDGAF